MRDTAEWLKYSKDNPSPVKYLEVFGSSQCGRFLRSFLYEGFNTDEHDRQAFDGMLIHIAGSAKINFNQRAATPVDLSLYSATSFPFADAAFEDPVSGVSEGVLENPRARRNQPKIFYTNTGVEYWGGARAAALLHVSPNGTKDIPLPANTRAYFLAGSQHSPAPFPPPHTTGEQTENPNNYRWALRALAVAMDEWVREGKTPPASAYPKIADGTLVPAVKVAFPKIAGVHPPNALPGGRRIVNPYLRNGAAPGTPVPLLVPQTDADGNERGGIVLPDVAVPLATYTGWNFRSAAIGGHDLLVALMGSFVPFPQTKKDGDPRAPIASRYSSRDVYLGKVKSSADALAQKHYVLTEDIDTMVRHAGRVWDLVTQQ